MTANVISQNDIHRAEVRNDAGEVIFTGVPRVGAAGKRKARDDCDWFLEQGRHSANQTKQGSLF